MYQLEKLLSNLFIVVRTLIELENMPHIGYYYEWFGHNLKQILFQHI